MEILEVKDMEVSRSQGIQSMQQIKPGDKLFQNNLSAISVVLIITPYNPTVQYSTVSPQDRLYLSVGDSVKDFMLGWAVFKSPGELT